MSRQNTKSNCYCAFCKSPRNIYYKKSLSLVNVIYCSLAALPIMYLMWQEFDPRVTVVFVLCLAFAEVFIKLRWRMSLACQTCGFDPVLYKKDADLASQKVKAHLAVRAQDPKYLLSKPLDLPKLPAVRAEALETKGKGRLVSRTL